MIHPESFKVTKENGPRPTGLPDKCFYCGRSTGQDHEESCACRQRTVILRFSVEILTVVGAGDAYTSQFITERFNNSTWCKSNALPLIERASEDDCLCGIASCVYEREATEEDEK